jgi:hypothetical protein
MHSFSANQAKCGLNSVSLGSQLILDHLLGGPYSFIFPKLHSYLNASTGFLEAAL